MITAIQTRYAGCHFRSRLEARWAVFFDMMGIRWEYEPERFALPCSVEEWFRSMERTYLPDFYLPETGTWVEVKGSTEALDWNHLLPFCDYDSPLPGLKDSYRTSQGLLLLGPIPRVHPAWGWAHPIIWHRKGLHLGHAQFTQASLTWQGQRWCCSWDRFQADGYATGAQINGWETLLADVPDDILTGHSTKLWSTTDLARSYAAARSARFEHGQKG